MISGSQFFILLYAWMGLAVVIFPILLRITVPYGRHTTNTWGPTLNNKWGWFLMEAPVVVVFSWYFFTGTAEKSGPVYFFYAMFMLHYFNRVFIFPLQIKNNGKRMPWLIVFMAVFFNYSNGFFNGYWFGTLSPPYDNSWFYDPRFIFGVGLFFTGMYINVTSDQTLLNLRKDGRKGYYIPYGGLFKYVSSPNLLGEIIEWLGWAMMSWCLPSFSFALWTLANLIPRALNHHHWYKRRFDDYPQNRKAVFPFWV
ncbi:MAG: DUF1295 domain-containing protein [Bacteroidales bacterium]|nr:DUF1295 domain-containing protein [Bacteroidales bacterium]